MSKEKNRRGDASAGDSRRSSGRSGRGGHLLRTRAVPLPYGVASAVLRDGILQSVEWESSRKRLEAALAEKFPGASEIDPGECAAGRLLQAYSGGRRVPAEAVAAIPVAWDRARGFQRIVLRELAKVPYGKTVTYGELAARAGRERAARAVGAALARNLWPVILPCHRVVGAGGRMVGFGKGIHAKRILLSFEERNLDVATGCPRNRQNV
ncbi:MAG: methylated-DNA--[protein]-cysteine S-methyltransferase [Candidatus Deferrimicrobiaceae bacterium]